jgi:UDP-N-acetylglucosamine/UDP-N-acetylgalactosamine diphosphorylase
MKQRTREDWRKDGVTVGNDVDLQKIEGDVVIHPGSRIQGEKTSIASGCIIGAETPAVIEDCQLGRGVQLKGGVFSGAAFFDYANMGSGAHVRAGTILEEEAGGAHSVGLKQTVFLPFVTAGSLINFCDALMTGGTSRKDHSEIGSSYVHFNYTPHQDKATASLIGDVPNGVFLDNKPVFLGGLGGLVGPARVAYGTVIAAGGVCRRDILEPDQLHIPAQPKEGTRAYQTGVYGNIHRLVHNNLCYIGNILALREWYRHARCRFVRDRFDQAVLDGGISNLTLIRDERVRRLGDLAAKMEYSIKKLLDDGGSADAVVSQQRFQSVWPDLEAKLKSDAFDQDIHNRDVLVAALDGNDYIACIKSVSPDIREAGRVWLQSIADAFEQIWRKQ